MFTNVSWMDWSSRLHSIWFRPSLIFGHIAIRAGQLLIQPIVQVYKARGSSVALCSNLFRFLSVRLPTSGASRHAKQDLLRSVKLASCTEHEAAVWALLISRALIGV
jgi:hypothetical protein